MTRQVKDPSDKITLQLKERQQSTPNETPRAVIVSTIGDTSARRTDELQPILQTQVHHRTISCIHLQDVRNTACTAMTDIEARLIFSVDGNVIGSEAKKNGRLCERLTSRQSDTDGWI